MDKLLTQEFKKKNDNSLINSACVNHPTKIFYDKYLIKFKH